MSFLPSDEFKMLRQVDGTFKQGERYIEIIKPLPIAGGDFLIKSRTTGVYDVGKAAIIETEQILTDKSGQEYVKMVGQGFIRDAGGFGGMWL